ncbi:hypothetical protein NHX12_006458 [Muraenolepis orangiensis]|uniref:KH homology domain-containing protein 4 n=1 Tax=Muraenolepis orangiensis TaxID=630683 RepID=A0A9Q0DTD3_9TELE|nr:hypothetical protein NHX12_006458 [Muraenolepis orangiensis]
MSWMTGQPPCLSSRWDQPAQPRQNVDDVRPPHSMAGSSSSSSGAPPGATVGPNAARQTSAHEGEKSVPPGGVEMAAAMAAKINAMLMAKGKLLTPPPLLAKGKNQEQVNKAVLKIKEIISEDVLRSALSGGQHVPVFPPLTLYPQPSRPTIPSAMLRLSNPVSAQGHRPAAPHSGALPSFNVNEKVEGPGGTYLGHIQTETGARVFLRGKTSGYIEQASKRESFEPLYVYIRRYKKVRAEHSRMVSVYTATGSTQPTQPMGMLAATQRTQEPLVIGDHGTNGETEGSPGSTPDPVSPKRHFQEDTGDQEPPTSVPSEAPAHVEPQPPASSVVEKGVERVLMPPPPLFVAPLPVTRKRPREPTAAARPPAAPPTSAAAPTGVVEVCVKKTKVVEDSSGLVPYGGDSSDEEEEWTQSS